MKWKARIVILAIFCFAIFSFLISRNLSDMSLSNRLDDHNPKAKMNKNKSEYHLTPEATDIFERNSHIGEGQISKRHPLHIWQEMVTERGITNESDALVNSLLNAMSTSNIISVDVGYRGTQLKAKITLHDLGSAVFKPKRYTRAKIIDGTPYEGYDRHNAEIAAFHLDRLLGFYRTPPVVGRILNLRELTPVIKPNLLDTFFEDHDGNTCFYGVCHYCRREEPACGAGSLMEGSLTLWIPEKWKISKKKHPWSRTYSKKKARWETDENYCDTVVQKPPYNKGPRLLDIMDAAVFDYLIGNADRHHYEYFSSNQNKKYKHDGLFLLIDNGKSFGNPYKDERTILSPLYQCCKLRRSTYERLKSFKSSSLSLLSVVLSTKLKKDPISPILTDQHLRALDRRLEKILIELETCFRKKGKRNVLLGASKG